MVECLALCRARDPLFSWPSLSLVHSLSFAFSRLLALPEPMSWSQQELLYIGSALLAFAVWLSLRSESRAPSSAVPSYGPRYLPSFVWGMLAAYRYVLLSFLYLKLAHCTSTGSEQMRRTSCSTATLDTVPSPTFRGHYANTSLPTAPPSRASATPPANPSSS
jgi:hypothetical protein